MSTTEKLATGSVATSVKEEMRKKKEEEIIPLGENIYSLLVVAPYFSWPFIFATFIVAIKLVCLSILITDIFFRDAEITPIYVAVLKACLIPVAIAMENDLMEAFMTLANGMWHPSMLEISTDATHFKLYLGYVLRTVDGILALYVNYAVLLVTADTKSIFLNFAALQFLYEIDEAFYELVKMGFFGDGMEHMTVLCSQIQLGRRYGSDNHKIWIFKISWLDTILFCFMCGVLEIIYLFFQLSVFGVI